MKISTSKPNSTANTWHYGALAVTLHWVIGALIIGMIGLGWYMLSIEKQPSAKTLFDLHKSLGFVAFGLIALRIVWRAGHRPEGLPDSVPVWQAKISNLIHWALYACMIVMPVTGYLGASHEKSAPKFFGIDTLNWAAPNHDLAEQFFSLHSIIAWALVILIVVHALAGIKHLIIDKDQVFERMWFKRGTMSR